MRASPSGALPAYLGVACVRSASVTCPSPPGVADCCGIAAAGGPVATATGASSRTGPGSGGGDAVAVREVPHLAQKTAPGVLGFPQLPQNLNLGACSDGGTCLSFPLDTVIVADSCARALAVLTRDAMVAGGDTVVSPGRPPHVTASRCRWGFGCAGFAIDATAGGITGWECATWKYTTFVEAVAVEWLGSTCSVQPRRRWAGPTGTRLSHDQRGA